MKLKELLQKYNVNIDLTDKLLEITLYGDYNSMKKEFHLMDNFTMAGYVKEEFDTYIFQGVDSELVLCPSNEYLTLTEHYKLQDSDKIYGYGYNSKGAIVKIV